jgi:protein-S-isoprenylcysteine O-methyltransferase Ste14
VNALENRIPPPLVAVAFVSAMSAWARWLPVFNVSFPGQGVATGLVVAAGLGVMAFAIAQFVRARTTIDPIHPAAASALVDRGVFGLTRNPMYLGLALVLSGLALWLGDGGSALLVAGFVAYITRFQIVPEERALRAKFGGAFDAYAARVRRWL